MAIGTSVPPRAYTREILTTAFNWLQSQPDAVRAKATTPDALVGLYTQAQRGGSTGAQTALELDAPVSSQSFMSDLKNLAEGLKEFDDSKAVRTTAPILPKKMSTMGAPIGGPMGVTLNTPMNAPSAPASAQAPTPAAPTAAPGSSASAVQTLNDRSLAMLREVQLTMNLSSEIEALNMMIAVAYKNLAPVLR